MAKSSEHTVHDIHAEHECCCDAECTACNAQTSPGAENSVHRERQLKLNRIRSSLIGSPLAVIRVITSLIPVLYLLLPVSETSPLSLFVLENYDAYHGIELLAVLKGTMIAISLWLIVSRVLVVVRCVVLPYSLMPRGKISSIILDFLILVSTLGAFIAVRYMPFVGFSRGTYSFLVFQGLNVLVDVIVLIVGIKVKEIPRCPECDRPVNQINGRRYCTRCGADLVGNGSEESILADAARADKEYQDRVNRTKASVFGSKLAIARLVSAVLPLVCLFFPLFWAIVSEPLLPLEGKVTGLTVLRCCSYYTGKGFWPFLGEIPLAVAFVSYILAVLATIVRVCLMPLSLAPKGKVRNAVMGISVLAFSGIAILAVGLLPDEGLVTGCLGGGAYLFLAVQVVSVLLDIITLRKGIPVSDTSLSGARCPKCNSHLKMTDWRQHCAYCGANIVVYDLQERLMTQADSAEVQFYHFQKKIDRLKGAFVGSKLAVTRIITSLIPVGALFLPLLKAKVVEPLKPMDGAISLLTIINNTDVFGDDGLNAILAEIPLVAAMGCLVLSVLATLVHFILLTLACSPKGKIRNIILDVLILLSTAGMLVCGFLLPNEGSFALVGTVGIGAYLYLLLQIVNVMIDVLTLVQGIEIHHKQCYVGGIPIEEYFEMVDNGIGHDEIRQEQYARLQAIQDEAERKLLEEQAKKESEKQEVKASE